MPRGIPPNDAKIGKKIDFIAASVGGSLKHYGFVRKARRIWREVGEGDEHCYQVIGMQSGEWNEGVKGNFCINIGIQMPSVNALLAEMLKQPWRREHAEEPDMATSNVQARLQDALPNQPESWWVSEMSHTLDVWFEIDEHTNLEHLSNVVQRATVEYILPWLAQHGRLEAIFSVQFKCIPGYTYHGSRLIAGLLLGRNWEVASLFSEFGSRWWNQPSFEDIKKWLLSRGVDVSDIEYTPPTPNPRIQQRNADIEAERFAAEKTERSLASKLEPVREHLPQMLDAFLEASRIRTHSDDESPIAKLISQADIETKRSTILIILERLVLAPTALDSRIPNVWGNLDYVHDHHWGNLVVSLLKGLPCDENFAKSLLAVLLPLTRRYTRPGIVCIGFPFPFPAIVKYLYKEALSWSEILKPGVAAIFEEIRKLAIEEYEAGVSAGREAALLGDADDITRMLAARNDEATRQRISDYPEQSFEKSDREAIGLLRKWIKRMPDGEESMEIEQDDWGRQFAGSIVDFPGDKNKLAALLNLLAGNVPTRPTLKFKRELAAWLSQFNADQHKENFAEWLDNLLRAYGRSNLNYEWATTGPRPGVGAFLGETSGNILVGLIHLARQWDSEHFTPALAIVVEAAFTLVPGIRMRSQKVATAAIDALGGSTSGRKILIEMQQQARKAAVRKILEATLKK